MLQYILIFFQVKATAENVNEAVRELPDANLVRYSFCSGLGLAYNISCYHSQKDYKYTYLLDFSNLISLMPAIHRNVDFHLAQNPYFRGFTSAHLNIYNFESDLLLVPYPEIFSCNLKLMTYFRDQKTCGQFIHSLSFHGLIKETILHG